MKKSKQIEIKITVGDVESCKVWLFDDVLQGIMDGSLKTTKDAVTFQMNSWRHLNPHDKCAVAYTVFSEVYENDEYIYGKWMNAKLEQKVSMLGAAMATLYEKVG